MATKVIMPKLGNTVESCIILEWKKAEGDKIKTGDILCDVETDKATFEIEAETDGTLLKIYFKEGEDVPVLTPIAVIGKNGENIDDIVADINNEQQDKVLDDENNISIVKHVSVNEKSTKISDTITNSKPKNINADSKTAISPRAKNLANKKGINLNRITGTGPDGRIIEMDVLKVIHEQEPFTPAAASIAKNMDSIDITRGTGIGGRILSSDLIQNGKTAVSQSHASTNFEFPGPVEEIPIKGIRKRISERMHKSLQTTAQLTINASADATSLLEYRKKLKASPKELELNNITINDLILFCVSKTLVRFKALNAHFTDDSIYKYENVHLANAVDTAKGLMVPVIRNANMLSLKEISIQARKLANECVEGTVNPDDLKGSTFTVTNLGALGVESFTPVINLPEVAVLGVGNIQLKPITMDDKIVFINHIGLSLTINHQVVDGTPAARFLKELSFMIANINLNLAL